MFRLYQRHYHSSWEEWLSEKRCLCLYTLILMQMFCSGSAFCRYAEKKPHFRCSMWRIKLDTRYTARRTVPTSVNPVLTSVCTDRAFNPLDAMLARYMLRSYNCLYVRPPVCLLQVDLYQKHLNRGSRQLHHLIYPGTLFWRQIHWVKALDGHNIRK